MINGEARTKAVAIIEEQEFEVILDNGSRNSNYISERTASKLMGRRYKQLLRVKTAKGDVSNLEEFLHLRIIIKLRGMKKFDEHLNFFIFPTLTSDIIVGRADLVKYKLYGLMQEIDEAEMEGDKSDSEEEQPDWDVERELELALIDELAEEKKKEDPQFDEYVRNMKVELEDTVGIRRFICYNITETTSAGMGNEIKVNRRTDYNTRGSE